VAPRFAALSCRPYVRRTESSPCPGPRLWAASCRLSQSSRSDLLFCDVRRSSFRPTPRNLSADYLVQAFNDKAQFLGW